MVRKKKKAASIKYFNDKLDIPVISALGDGIFAEKIINVAKKNGIEIIENNDFFKYENLFKVANAIPKEVYKIVSEILVSIINTNKEGYNVKSNIN